MNWKEFFWEKEIESDIKFDKEMMTVYDLTYMNNLCSNEPPVR